MDRNTLHTPRRLSFEPLEDRRMLAVFTVINLDDAPVAMADDAPGTLRQAVFDANSLPDADVIQFAPGLSGAINLSVIGDAAAGPTALLITSEVAIQGNAAGITIARDSAGPEMRLFHVASIGSLTMESVSLTGGIARGQSDEDGRGGAIYNEGTLQIIASTLHDNWAIGGDAMAGPYSGAGLGAAIFSDSAVVLLENATLSGNVAQSGTGPIILPSFGAGVYARHGTLSIYNSTITDSTATSARGVYAVNTGETLTLNVFSSIIAQADLPSFMQDLIVDSLPEYDTSVGGEFNIIRRQNNYHEITDSNADPGLDVLADNGGPTHTHAIQTGSPAIDRGANPQSLPTDQRGPTYARVIGAQADIGAFEQQTPVGPALPGDYSGNEVVDAADYVLWRKTYGTPVESFAGADGNGNGLIDEPDYDVWRGNFGATNPGAAATAAVVMSTASAATSAASPRSLAFDSLASSRPIRVSHSPNRNTAAYTRQQITPLLAQRPHDEALFALFAESHNDFADPESENGTLMLKPAASPRLTDTPFDELVCDIIHSDHQPLAV